MKVHVSTVRVETTRRLEIVDITGLVEHKVKESSVRNGIVTVFVPHATAAIIANEYEPRLVEDYIEAFKSIAPPGRSWRHNVIDDNAHAHLIAGIIGPSRQFPLVDGRIERGTWQNIMLVELDGPRTRRIIVHIIGG